MRGWSQASNLPELNLENGAVRDYLFAKPGSLLVGEIPNGVQ